MAVTIGTRIGPYEIKSSLGEGGMGVVYRALDTKLQREIALKFLPEHFADDPERLARFQREAQVLASLNHPNIAQIYGLEDSAAQTCIVMELVEGETLQDRQRRGPIPVAQALAIATQIASALEAAHERGIVHRDLKPANVKVLPDGTVKVLDFGLAKTTKPDAGKLTLANAPTLDSAAGTIAGVILGTAGYMSPEQARGETVDHRTDIFTFGCVLYEMLSGRQAFEGKTVSDSLVSILTREPDSELLPPELPASVRILLSRCLAKDMRLRWQAIGDLRFELEHYSTEPASIIGTPARAGRRTLRSMVIAFVSLLAGIVISGLIAWRIQPPPPRAVNRFAITLPASQRLAGLDLSLIAFSPDGKRLVFVGRAGGTKQLYVRELDDWRAKPIPGTEGASNPFFSPDGQWIGFFTLDRLKKVSLSGGPPLILAEVTNPRGGSWGIDGNIIFSPKPGSGLSSVSSSGGAVRTLTTPDAQKGEVSHRFPHHLANTGAVLFTVGRVGTWDDARIEMLNPATGARKVLVEGGSDARYIPTGHLVYLRAGALMGVRFNLQQLEAVGSPVPLVDGVFGSTDNTGAAQADFSALGSLAYVSGDRQAPDRTLTWVDRNGAEQPLPLPPRFYRHPRISPDGRRIVLDIDEGNKSDLWLYDLVRGTLTRTTFEGMGAFAIWTPDGNKVAFQNINNSAGTLGLASVDGTDAGENLTTAGNSRWPASWSPDGETLAFIEFDAVKGMDLWTLSRKEGRKVRAFLQTPFNETNPSFSHDGHWIAYQSDESGRDEIYVQPFPGPGGKIQVSADGGTEPVWSADGHELFYRDGDKLIAVPVTLQPTFHPSKPAVLFEKPYFLVPAYRGSLYPRSYDVTPDGRRFLMIKENEQVSAATGINVVLNWFEELKQRVPVH